MSQPKKTVKKKIPSRIPPITWREFEPWAIGCPALAVVIIEDLQQLVDTYGKEVRIRMDAGHNNIDVEYGVQLAACRFCGSSMVNVGSYGTVEQPTKKIYRVACVECLALGPVSRVEADAISLWNVKGASSASTKEKQDNSGRFIPIDSEDSYRGGSHPSQS